MTKAEIIEHFQHLSDTVEAKDKEINELKNKHSEEIGILKEQHLYEVTQLKNPQLKETLKHDAKRELEKEYVGINDELRTLRADFNRIMEGQKDVDEVVKKLKTISAYEDTIKLRNSQISELISIHGDLLKQLQGIANNGIRLNEYYVEKVMR